ncbi:MAG: hypothetical protein ACE5I7_11620 [Candidatus Binatia bacterium]
MRTVKWIPFLSGGCLLLGGVLLWANAARADVSSTNSAAILVFPKIVVETSATRRVDTVIQITNTSAAPVDVRCFLVNANGHCSNSGTVCDPNGDPAQTTCGSFEFCVPGWQESDFRFRLSPKQPIAWPVSEGLLDLPLAQFNDGSILPAPEDPLMGELKCIEVQQGNEAPVDRNDLKGEATIVSVSDGPTVDSRGYNAIGIQAIPGANNGDDTLVLGEEYNACPNILVLDHFFDDAIEPSSVGDTVRTSLTLVPCSEDFNLQEPITTTVQFLVFNEFEQRFSTSRPVTCFSEIDLSDIDTRPGPSGDAQSLFNVNVQGTLTGQSLIRGVADADTGHGHGLLAVAEEFHGANPFSASAAFVAHQRGVRTQRDIVQLPLAQPQGP